MHRTLRKKSLSAESTLLAESEINDIGGVGPIPAFFALDDSRS